FHPSRLQRVSRKTLAEPFCASTKRLRVAAREDILGTAGGSDGSYKSIAVGCGGGAIVRIACCRASFFCRGVRREQNRDVARNCLQSRLGQSAHLCLYRRERRRRQDHHVGVAIIASAVLPRKRADEGCVVKQQTSGDFHGQSCQGRYGGLRVHDKV